MAREPFEERFAQFLRSHPRAPENDNGFTQMLRTAFPGETKQTGAVIVAWKAGIADDISSMRSISSAFASAFARRLIHDKHMNQEMADWAVKLWVTAYGRDVLGRTTDVAGFASAVCPAAEDGTIQNPVRARIRYRSIMGSKIVEGCDPPLPAALVVPDRHDDMPVRTIAAHAFYESPVRYVVLGTNVRTIGEEAFANCIELVQAVLPTGLEVIEREAFAECSRLQAIKLPDSLVRIDNGALMGTRIAQAVIPDSVRSLGEGVFEGCASASDADVGLGITVLPSRTFADCTSLAAADLPVRLERISQLAFENCTSLLELRIPDSVKHIEDGAFRGANPELTLIGRRHSAAQYYAERHGMRFKEFF